MYGRKWTNLELSILASTDDIAVLQAKLPNRSLKAIKSKKKEISLPGSLPWTQEEIALLPKEVVFNKATLLDLMSKLPTRTREEIYKKLQASGYKWESTAPEEATEDNPYPDSGKKWTKEEISLFPENKEVTSEVLAEVQALLPRRKPTAIWPKMKSEGYIWVSTVEDKIQEVTPLNKDEAYVLSLAYELGFRASNERGQPTLSPALPKQEDLRPQIAKNLNLPEDFNSGELLYAIIERVSPFPWDSGRKEIAQAYKTRSKEDIRAAAEKLHTALGYYLNG
jgi:hypothetical protein